MSALPKYSRALLVLRRDLRLSDHAALARACVLAMEVHLLFVFDKTILDALLDPEDRRVDFIWQSLQSIDEDLSGQARVLCAHGYAKDVVPVAARALEAGVVLFNHDDEPQALERDAAIRQTLHQLGIDCVDLKDQSVFERDEVLTQAARPYTVFTPYRNAWMKRLDTHPEAADPHRVDRSRLRSPTPKAFEGLTALLSQQGARLWLGPPPSLEDIGFRDSGLAKLGIRAGERGAEALLRDFEARIADYAAARDYPALKGPSYLSVHLRFGTLSIRAALRLARAGRPLQEGGPGFEATSAAHPSPVEPGRGAATWLNELVWRDFYMQLLHHYPHAARGAFKPEYARIVWEAGEQADAHFAAWCEGRTGFPVVDAAMRQLLHSGYMHNRLRMVTASFLCKDLGIDWRRGEAWFARKLIDFDLAANNGGWQWAASSGCDAQPYFRIFNPVSQSMKFDAEGRFIRRYVPELAALGPREIHAPWKLTAERRRELEREGGARYPTPIIDHDAARIRTLMRYQVVKSPSENNPTARRSA